MFHFVCYVWLCSSNKSKQKKKTTKMRQPWQSKNKKNTQENMGKTQKNSKPKKKQKKKRKTTISNFDNVLSFNDNISHVAIQFACDSLDFSSLFPTTNKCFLPCILTTHDE